MKNLSRKNKSGYNRTHLKTQLHFNVASYINLLNAELNPICHFMALLGAHTILHVSRIRVKLPQKFSLRLKFYEVVRTAKDV